MQRMMYVEYSRDSESPKEVTDKKVMSVREFNKLKKFDWINIIKCEELNDDWAVKCAKKNEWSKFSSDTLEGYNYPITPSGVGGSAFRTRWTYTIYGQYLCAFNFRSGVEITFNLNRPEDIKSKLDMLYALRDSNRLNPDDVSELEERLRTYSTLEIGGNAPQSLAGIGEGVKHKKGEKYYTYEDGVKKEHIARGSSSHSTDDQKRAAENARKYAHTESAKKKRRKSIKARGDGKILKEI